MADQFLLSLVLNGVIYLDSSHANALVICNHCPLLIRRVVDSRGNELAFYQNTQGLLYTGKKGSEMKRQHAAGENSSGFTNEQSPQCGLLAGICWTKNQSPSYSPGVGGRRGYK